MIPVGYRSSQGRNVSSPFHHLRLRENHIFLTLKEDLSLMMLKTRGSFSPDKRITLNLSTNKQEL